MSDFAWQKAKDAGAAVSLAVPIEMNMAHGTPPILKAQSLGFRPSLSTDVECTLTADMFTQMRTTMALQRMFVNANKLAEPNTPPTAGPLLTTRDVIGYAVALGDATRHPGKYGLHELEGLIEFGASPRGPIGAVQAAQALASWRLLDCTLYVTLEPCPMCDGAIVQARIPRVIYGATDPKAGACHTLYSITDDLRLNHRAAVLGGVLQEECKALFAEWSRSPLARSY